MNLPYDVLPHALGASDHRGDPTGGSVKEGKAPVARRKRVALELGQLNASSRFPNSNRRCPAGALSKSGHAPRGKVVLTVLS
jgi:hypothetical protein